MNSTDAELMEHLSKEVMIFFSTQKFQIKMYFLSERLAFIKNDVKEMKYYKEIRLLDQ